MGRSSVIIVACLMLFIFGISDGIKDALSFHYWESKISEFGNHDFWNPEISWKNKYRDVDNGDFSGRFLGSKTVFSFVTDGWHLFKFIGNNALIVLLILLIVLYLRLKWYWFFVAFVCAKLLVSLGFHLMYSVFLFI